MDAGMRRNSSIFQSTLPQGERLPGTVRFLLVRYFNPRSRKGSDCSARRFLEQIGDFNPRSRKGSDSQARATSFCMIDFNPRSRKGSDVFRSASFAVSAAFQSTLPQGERRMPLIPRMGISYFNPRSRKGSDHGYSDKRSPEYDISIHAPARGATLRHLH